MQRDYKEIHGLVKKKLALGASNATGASEFTNKITEHMREINDFIFTRLKIDSRISHDVFQLHQVLACFLAAFFAETFETGRCGEFAAVTLVECLKRGVDKSIEILSLDGTTIDNKPGNHSVVVLNREAKSDLQDPKTWGEVTIIDAWHTAESKHYAQTKPPTKTELSSIHKPDFTISCDLRLERNLSILEWSAVVKLLKKVRDIFFPSKQYKKMLKQMGCKESEVDKNSAFLIKKMSAKIAEYEKLRNEKKAYKGKLFTANKFSDNFDANPKPPQLV